MKMWRLLTKKGYEICRKETLEEIGKERMWYENRGYDVTVERVPDEGKDQSILSFIGREGEEVERDRGRREVERKREKNLI